MDNGIQSNMNGMQPNNFPNYTKYLVLSIIQTFCCSSITGILALVFTVIANSAFKVGNFAEYEYKVKVAKTSLIVGWIIAAAIWIFTIIWCIFIIFIENQAQL